MINQQKNVFQQEIMLIQRSVYKNGGSNRCESDEMWYLEAFAPKYPIVS